MMHSQGRNDICDDPPAERTTSNVQQLFLEASHGITATVAEEKSNCKEERQKAVNEKYQRDV